MQYISLPSTLMCFVVPHDRADGRAQISTTVPDTITSWIASAFAVNSISGLGVADSPAKVGVYN